MKATEKDPMDDLLSSIFGNDSVAMIAISSDGVEAIKHRSRSNPRELDEAIVGLSTFEDFLEGMLGIMSGGRPPHSHRCKPCDITFEHDTASNGRMSEKEYEKAHACPGCGQQVRKVHSYNVMGKTDAPF